MAQTITQNEASSADGAFLLDLFGMMARIRMVEEHLSALFAAGKVPGFIHLSIGQEAVAAGIMAALLPADTIASNHRGHGHSIAKGMDLDRFFFEILAKKDGACGGRGGSMHVADLSVGMLGANGIVGAGISIAVGSALAHKIKKTGHIAAVFFGDGARAEGVFHESINIAALQKLPMLFICENNGWSEFSAGSTQFAADLQKLAAAFGIPYRKVDGNDVEAVAACAGTIVADIKNGRGPYVLECITQRVQGHFEGDAQKYRLAEEIAALSEADPLHRARARLEQIGVSKDQLDGLLERISSEVAASLGRAQSAEEPDFEATFNGVYTPQGH